MAFKVHEIPARNESRIVANGEKFIRLLNENVISVPVQPIIDALKKTDFFDAPASAKYHGAFPGGLCEHSLIVYDSMLALSSISGESADTGVSLEDITIVALLHDICKVNFYIQEDRRVQNPETKQWRTVKAYGYAERPFELGHGSGSVISIQRYLPLTHRQQEAIMWHMGAFDASGSSTNLSAIYSRNHLAALLHLADSHASWIVEGLPEA